jgi:glycosyltransferase involved in cell wall biosynthesis
MPVYNAGDFLLPAVESIRGQTLSDWELILVDDGSTDGAVDNIARIEDARIRILRQENRGKPAAMNRALAAAGGEYYALQDADDTSYPARLERQAACLDEHADVAGVFCGHDVIVNGQTVAPTTWPKTAAQCADEIALGMMPGHDPTAMYRMSMVRSFSYAEDLPVVEGFDYVLRVGEQYPLMVLGECLYSYRIHVNSVTKNDPSRRNELLQQAQDRMRARRGLPPLEITPSRPITKARESDNDLVSHFTASVADLIRSGRRGEAFSAGMTCWRMNPGHAYYAKPLLYSFMPRAVVEMWRAHKERGQKRRIEAGGLAAP